MASVPPGLVLLMDGSAITRVIQVTSRFCSAWIQPELSLGSFLMADDGCCLQEAPPAIHGLALGSVFEYRFLLKLIGSSALEAK